MKQLKALIDTMKAVQPEKLAALSLNEFAHVLARIGEALPPARKEAAQVLDKITDGAASPHDR